MDKNKENQLLAILDGKKMEPFIRHIRFPFYKNLTENTRINFTFPITALVGQNGTNKSSVLKALYGSPINYSLGNLWFSTKIDPIEDGGRSRFIYGYYDQYTKKIVEVIKARIKKTDDPDYWEPTRPAPKDGMVPVDKTVISKNKSQTRWNAITKKVVYFDFRAQLSAFDKSFYHSDLIEKEKKSFLRSRSTLLYKHAIQNQKKSYEYYGIERIKNNIELPKEEVKQISIILGRKYDNIKIIEHSFFNKNQKNCTAILKTSSLNYSEAFAGSGEFAIVMLVHRIFEAAACSLILLDEPEVSLHPAAQERLMDFLFQQCLTNKHQIVLCTHSSSIVKTLPKKAIKLFHYNEISKTVDVLEDIGPEEAFYYLGDRISKKTVFLEDALASEIVKKALNFDPALESQFDIKFVPGGAEVIMNHMMTSYSAAGETQAIFLLDGDKDKKNEIQASNSIPEDKNSELGKIIFNICGCHIKPLINGNLGKSDSSSLIKGQRIFIDYLHNYLIYLPMNTPESFILENLSGDYKKMLENVPKNIVNEKKVLSELSKQDIGNSEKCSAKDILETEKRILARIIKDLPEFQKIREILKNFLDEGSVR